MFKLKTSAIIAHIIGWLMFLSLPLLFMSGRLENEKLTSIILSRYYWLFFFSYIFIFYFHTYFLLPQLYFKKRFILYFVIVILLLTVTYFMSPFDHLFSQ